MVGSSASNGSSVAPHVSVVLPSYNGSVWLPAAVESVCSQHGVDWELIVVDDGSIEDPGPTLERFGDGRIRYLRRPHTGKGAVLNAGIGFSRADLVCFIDQDDIMLPGRLQLQVEAFRRHPSAKVVYSDYERRDDMGRLIDRFTSCEATAEEALHQMAVGRSPVAMQTVMLRKTVCEALGGFSERPELTGLDDLEFLVRLFLAHPVMAYAPGVVQCWVRHGCNFSGSGAFQETRLHALARLSQLAVQFPLLRCELKHFAFHNRCMRGIHFLESERPGRALAEFLKALAHRPAGLNAYYLLLKSIARWMVPRQPKPVSPAR